jgi:hypothetical protein
MKDRSSCRGERCGVWKRNHQIRSLLTHRFFRQTTETTLDNGESLR